MSVPVPKNFVVVENDTFEATITLVDRDTGDAIDLTDATVEMYVLTDYDDASALLTFTIGDGITVAAPLTGVIVISKLVPLAAAEYVYGLRVRHSVTVVRTCLRGAFTVLDEATA